MNGYIASIKKEHAVDKLTKAERASEASNDSNSIFWVSTKLEENWREGIPFALQLHKNTRIVKKKKKKSTWSNTQSRSSYPM